MARMRCPHCGSPATLRGSRWVCGWCGDFGVLAPVEEQRRGIAIHVTVTEPPAEPPQQFTQPELEDLVRRWDLEAGGDTLRELLLAAFPEAAACVAPEEAAALEAPALLEAVYEKDPDLAVAMWRKALDAAQDHLGAPERAAYLLCELMDGVWCGSVSLWFVLKSLRENADFARQVFGSAYVGYPQAELLKACDAASEPALKAAWTALLEDNPYFEGFH